MRVSLWTSLNDTVLGPEGMLRGLIGEGVELVIETASDLGTVEADPGRIEQVILNLVSTAGTQCLEAAASS